MLDHSVKHLGRTDCYERAVLFTVAYRRAPLLHVLC